LRLDRVEDGRSGNRQLNLFHEEHCKYPKGSLAQ